MPGPPPSAPHGSDSRYRYGCHCTDCRSAHTETSNRWKRDRKFGPGAPYGPAWQRQVLTSLKKTRSVTATAKAIGVPHQAIYGAAKAVPSFGAKVAELTQAAD